MKTNAYAVILTTTSSLGEAEKIARALLAGKLAACVQVLPIKSYYPWQGQVQVDDEQLLLIKCRSADFEAIATCIRANHSYELPEIVQLPITNGLQDYLGWISQVTGERS
jgi:periplasmic divalent cation tolerance protein